MLFLSNKKPMAKVNFKELSYDCMRLNIDTIFIGNAKNLGNKESVIIQLMQDSGHDVHVEDFEIKEKHAYVFQVKDKSPARYAFYQKLIEKNPNVDITFPRTSSRIYRRTKSVVINA